MGRLGAGFVLLVVTSLSTASSPGCEDLVKPFMPDDPEMVSLLFTRGINRIHQVMYFGADHGEMDLCDGSW